MAYKLSKFNNIIYENGTCTIYNSFTSGVLGLNEYYTNELKKIKNGSELDLIDCELIKNLESAKMLVPADLDEVEYISVLSNASRFDSTSLNLTIAPTLACNFACPYCYEKGRRYNTMDENTINQLLTFIKVNSQENKPINIVWYGGEPLLAITTIEYISNALSKMKLKYNASIVTNGYLLNKKMAERLKAINIQHAQVTIDGPEEIHNKRRILQNGNGSFKKILENIESICNIIPITIRVNVDKENIENVDSLLDSFDKYHLNGKISVYLAPLDNINQTCNSSTCFSQKEFSEEQIGFYKKYSHRGYFFIAIPRSNVGICGAVRSSFYIIDPIGDLYKCWDDIGNKSEVIGTIANPDILSAKNIEWLSYNPLNDPRCKKCSILPVCMGGCPNNCIKRGETKCHPIKYNLIEYIDLKKNLCKYSVY